MRARLVILSLTVVLAAVFLTITLTGISHPAGFSDGWIGIL